MGFCSVIFVFTAAFVVINFPGNVESKICWETTLHNTSNPAVNGSEYEGLSKAERARICPHGVMGARCADDKLEWFSSNKTDNVNEYNASCSVDHGLECHPFGKQKTCPDMAIQYGCDCSTMTVGSGSKTTIATKISLQQNTSAGQGASNQNQNGDKPDNSSEGKQYRTRVLILLVLVARIT